MPSWGPPLIWCCCVSISLLTLPVNACRMQSFCRDQPQPLWGCCCRLCLGCACVCILDSQGVGPGHLRFGRLHRPAVLANMLHTKPCRGMLLRWNLRLMRVPVMPAGSCLSSPVCGRPAPGRCAGQGQGRPLSRACSCDGDGGPQGTQEATAGGAGQHGSAAAGRSPGAALRQLSERWLQGR